MHGIQISLYNHEILNIYREITLMSNQIPIHLSMFNT